VCGISGICSFVNGNRTNDLSSLINAQSHRGPDATGIWEDEVASLGHNRLAIIDLDTKANQPMISSCGNYIMVFNGEIYNHKEVKAAMPPFDWKTKSDSEVLLEAYILNGPEVLHQLNGMFAFAIWNRKDKSLFIARDRLGIKPVYFATIQNEFIFASELRALLASDKVSHEVNIESLNSFLRFQWIQAPETIMKDISLLEPGHFLKYNSQGLIISQWWSIDPTSQKQNIALEDAQTAVKNLFYKAVDRRTMSDVPIGAFLSGGIDSSAVVAAMAKSKGVAINTFSIGFEESEFDESAYARIIADQYKTNHQTLIYKAGKLRGEVPQILSTFDTPSADGVNSYIISRMVKEAGITVVLSGLGGDELFGGYPVFGQMTKIEKAKYLWKLPKFARRLLSKMIRISGKSTYAKLTELIETENCKPNTIYPFFRQIFSQAQSKKLLRNKVNKTHFEKSLESKRTSDLFSWISTAEIIGYTQNVLLKDSDMCSMHHSLELRVPFFDHELLEYVLSLPEDLKKLHPPKALLTNALKEELPSEIINRKKMGFAFPWDQWIRGELKPFVEETLNKRKHYSFFNAHEIEKLWREYLENKGGLKWYHIWNLVCVIHWLETNLPRIDKRAA